VIEEELAKMERAGYVTDYAAGLLTHPCMLDYLLRNNYLPY
jgi:hypothetical protein